MKKNLGSEDRIVRLLVGAALVINIVVIKPGIAGTLILAVSGVALIATAIVGFCSLYLPIKLDTRSFFEKNSDAAVDGKK